MLTREQFLAFLDTVPNEEPDLYGEEESPTQEEKDALLASLAGQKDTFPSKILLLTPFLTDLP